MLPSMPALWPSTSTATSACEMAVMVLGTKSRWPGASSSVKQRVGVSKAFVPTSIVTPRSRSAPSSSSTHAKANEALPMSRASRAKRCSWRAETTPRSYSRCPISVLLPASTCPIVTTDSRGLSSCS